MKTTITIQRTDKGAILVNGQLMRTRTGVNYDMSTKEATYVIMKDILCDAGVSQDLLDHPYVFQVAVSDKEFSGASKLVKGPSWTGFSQYGSTRCEDFVLPCRRWFKKLTGIDPPETVWLKLIFFV